MITDLAVIENMSAVKVMYIELPRDVAGDLVDLPLDIVLDRAQD